MLSFIAWAGWPLAVIGVMYLLFRLEAAGRENDGFKVALEASNERLVKIGGVLIRTQNDNEELRGELKKVQYREIDNATNAQLVALATELHAHPALSEDRSDVLPTRSSPEPAPGPSNNDVP